MKETNKCPEGYKWHRTYKFCWKYEYTCPKCGGHIQTRICNDIKLINISDFAVFCNNCLSD